MIPDMVHFFTVSSESAAHHGGGTSISTFHPDIVHTHILTRLDGPTLAATACVSSELHALCTDDELWREICNSTWPSVNDPRVGRVISAFPAGYRSFFSDSFPFLDQQQDQSKNRSSLVTVPTGELISCVDLYYKETLIISKNQEIETDSGWFWSAPFRVDLLDFKETVPTPLLLDGQDNAFLKDLEQNLSLNWILIDTTEKRAANLSSGSAVTVERHWLTGDFQARFTTIMAAGDQRSASSESELVKCELVVTCGGKEGGEVHVREVRMQVEDMEGRNMSGRDSLVILENALRNGRRKRGKGEEGKERYEEFVERKKERRERKERREKILDLVFMGIGITVFMAFWGLMLFR